MTQQPHLALVPLKREPLARGKRAPRAPSIVGWFCQLPWQGFVGGLVAPPACLLALVAKPAPPGVMREGARNDQRLATIPDELTGVEQASLSPRCDEPVLPPHDGPSVEPVQSKRCSVAQ